jgi:hypothetical protein
MLRMKKISRDPSYQKPETHFSRQELYKTKMCRTYDLGTNCPFEEFCRYAHSEEELRTVTDNQHSGHNDRSRHMDSGEHEEGYGRHNSGSSNNGNRNGYQQTTADLATQKKAGSPPSINNGNISASRQEPYSSFKPSMPDAQSAQHLESELLKAKENGRAAAKDKESDDEGSPMSAPSSTPVPQTQLHGKPFFVAPPKDIQIHPQSQQLPPVQPASQLDAVYQSQAIQQQQSIHMVQQPNGHRSMVMQQPMFIPPHQAPGGQPLMMQQPMYVQQQPGQQPIFMQAGQQPTMMKVQQQPVMMPQQSNSFVQQNGNRGTQPMLIQQPMMMNGQQPMMMNGQQVMMQQPVYVQQQPGQQPIMMFVQQQSGQPTLMQNGHQTVLMQQPMFMQQHGQPAMMMHQQNVQQPVTMMQQPMMMHQPVMMQQQQPVMMQHQQQQPIMMPSMGIQAQTLPQLPMQGPKKSPPMIPTVSSFRIAEPQLPAATVLEEIFDTEPNPKKDVPIPPDHPAIVLLEDSD